MSKGKNSVRGLALLGVFSFVVFTGAESSCSPGEREEDLLEPNDEVATATELSEGVPVEARVNQRNADYFCIDAAEPGTVTFAFESRGLEDCSIYEIVAPDGEILHSDHELLCSSPRESDTTDRVSVDNPGDGTRTLTVRADAAGRYCVGVRELGMADNLLPFSWDYRLVATTEPVATP